MYSYPLNRNLDLIPTFTDATWSEIWPLEKDMRSTDLLKGNGNSQTNQLADACIARHRYLSNVAFLDGHAESKPLAQLWTLRWHANWVTPTKLPIIP
jgi:prepilin-type processing-associated H-X9-DG protein